MELAFETDNSTQEHLNETIKPSWLAQNRLRRGEGKKLDNQSRPANATAGVTAMWFITWPFVFHVFALPPCRSQLMYVVSVPAVNAET